MLAGKELLETSGIIVQTDLYKVLKVQREDIVLVEGRDHMRSVRSKVN